MWWCQGGYEKLWSGHAHVRNTWRREIRSNFLTQVLRFTNFTCKMVCVRGLPRDILQGMVQTQRLSSILHWISVYLWTSKNWAVFGAIVQRYSTESDGVSGLNIIHMSSTDNWTVISLMWNDILKSEWEGAGTHMPAGADVYVRVCVSHTLPNCPQVYRLRFFTYFLNSESN